MPGFTVSAAARLCRVDRRTLQRAIQAGRLPLDAQHCLSREALIAAGYLDVAAPQDTPQYTSQDTPQELEQATTLLDLLERLTAPIVALHTEVQSLRDDLRQMPRRTPQVRRRRTLTAPQVTPHCTPQSMSHYTPQRTPQSTPQSTPQGMPQDTPRASPQILGTYDPQAAAARIQALRRQGLSFVRIAAQFDAEGLPTRFGLPWQHRSVRHLFKTYG